MEYRIIKSKSYKRFLFSYIYVLVIPIIVLTVVYQISKSTLRQNEVDNRLFTLTYIRDIIDKNLEYIDSSVHEISINTKLNQLMYYNKPIIGSSDMYWFYEYFNNFNKLIDINSSFESSIHVYLKKSETVISTQQMTLDFEDYYENYVHYKDIDYTSYISLFMDERNYRYIVPKKRMSIYGKEGNFITILYSIPLLSFSHMGAIACFIDTDPIEQYLKEVTKSEESKSFIIDANNNLIVGEVSSEFDFASLNFTNKEQTYFTFKAADNMEMLSVYTRSNFNDWIYVSQIPMYEITRNINFLNNASRSILVIAVIAACVGAVYISYKNTQPLISLYDTVVGELGVEQPANIDIELLKGGIRTLIIDKKKLQDSLIRQNSALKTIYLDKLLNGYFENINQLNKQLAYVNTSLMGNFYIVTIVKINPDEKFISKNIAAENDMFRFMIEQMLYDAVGSKGIAHILAENEMALIILFESELDIRKNVETILQNMNNSFMAQFNFQPTYGIGNARSNMDDIHITLQEAKYALNKMDSCINWYEDLPQDKNIYLYSNDLEAKIVNLVKSGNWNEVNLILTSIFDELFIEETVASPMQRLVLCDLQITIIKLNDELKYYNDLKDLIEATNNQNARIVFKTIKKYFKEICNKQIVNVKKRNNVLHEKILHYINENFNNNDLCINKIAGQFNISESYFSQFFKEQVKENFSHYLEKMRIDHSISLLKETDLTIDEIAVKSGYNSTNSFRRAFKRVMGMPPSEYNNLYHLRSFIERKHKT